jgi:hypothetical protein
MFGIDYVLIGLVVYLLVAIGHFFYFLKGVHFQDGAVFAAIVLLGLAALFWPIAHIAYWIHLIRTR